MLIPKKQKYRKEFRCRKSATIRAAKAGTKPHRKNRNPQMRKKRVATSGFQVAFGTYGLKAITEGELTSRQIEAARRAMTRFTKRVGKIWIRIFPHKPITQKAAEVPMGKGKGALEYYVFFTLPGKVLFEIEGVTEEVAREAFRLASNKLPLGTKFVERIHL